VETYNNKVAIITGGASGIGKALGQHLLGQRAKVIVADLNIAEVNTGSGGFSQAHQVDVAQADQVQKLVDKVVAEYGRLDYMFNNAGFAIGGELRYTSLENWDKIINVNLKGVIHGIAAAYPVMIQQGYGHIVNTASLAGLIPSPGLGAYSTTKHAVVGLSQCLRTEAAGLGVKVSVLCPGFIETNIFANAIAVGEDRATMRETIPFKFMQADHATRLMLEGIAKNQAIITMPRYAYVSWGIYRLSPALLGLVNRLSLGNLRRANSAKSG